MNHLPSLAQILSIPDPPPRLALDRSVRRIDTDGHLHVGPSIISAAGVSSYWGSEIPDFEKLGLRPNTEYRLFRPPDELRKAAPTFQNKPLLSLHRPVSATDHAPSLVVGSIGSPVVLQGTDLLAPLVVWDAVSIESIMDNSIKALSCGYRYRADMASGSYNGERFDGSMVDLVGNHCALVEAGRVPGAIVGDAAMTTMDGYQTMNDPTELQLFLARKLSGDDLNQANALLEELIRDPNATIAEDGIRRRAAQAMIRSNAKLDAKYAEMFPGLTKLKHRAY